MISVGEFLMVEDTQFSYGPEGIRALTESQVITGLVELHLERNDLGDEGTRIMAESSN